MNHYEEVPRQEQAPNVISGTRMVPLDLEATHNRQHRIENITLKIRFILPIIYLLTCFPLAFIMLLISLARPVGEFYHEIGALQTISYISQSNPVVDIQPIYGGQTCMLDTYLPGNLGFWEGIYAGCSCPGKAVKPLICGSADIGAGCTTINSIDGIKAFSWNGDRFCMRRLFDFVRTAGACPAGYTKCGTLICVRTGELCPITDVKFLKSTDPTPTGYTERSLTFDNKLAFISQSGSDTQFVQFSYSTGAPCIDLYQYQPRATKLTYNLDKEPHFGCNHYTADGESVQLDSSVLESTFYNLNNIGDKIQSAPPYTNIIQNSYVTLSARYRYRTIAKDVCAQFYISDVSDLVINVESFKLLYRGISIAGMILTTITAFIAIVYIRVLKRDGFWMVFREETFGRRFIVQLVLLQTAFAIVTTILGNISNQKVSGQESYIKSIANANCFAGQSELNRAMHNAATYLSNRIDGLIFLNNLLLFISAATAGSLIILIIFRKTRGYERYQQ